MITQLQHLLRPLATRIANTVARGVVQLVDDDKKMQLLQIGVLDGEPIDDAEHFQPDGFTSVPMPGAEVIVAFPNGDRSHPLVSVVADRRHRPTGGKPGERTIYHHKGAKIRMLDSGDIEIQPAPGREILIRDEGGNAERLVKKSEFDAHKHGPGNPATGGYSAPPNGGPVTGTSGVPTEAATGTQRLRSQ